MTRMRSHTIATAAYEVVAARQGSDIKKKYGALAHKLPGLVLQNGLAQATGFLLAKGQSKPEHLDLLNDLRSVLHAARATDADSGQALHTQIIAADLEATMLLTRRTLEAAGWIKRYVQGVLGVDATGEAVADAADGTSQGG
ncbi:MAG: type III-B CRISPR module-associated protein Cmr5 [Chromatiaceae bacterium]